MCKNFLLGTKKEHPPFKDKPNSELNVTLFSQEMVETAEKGGEMGVGGRYCADSQIVLGLK